MKEYFTEIFKYHHRYNLELANQLEAYDHQLDPKLRALFCHTINAHQIWNARIMSGQALGVHDQHSFDACRLLNDSNFRKTVEILSSEKLEKEIRYHNSKGREFVNQIGDILFHVANHTTHHRGQIIAEIRKAGIEPIVTDFIFYKRG